MCNRSPEELNMWFYINTSLFERCTAHAGECGAVVRALNNHNRYQNVSYIMCIVRETKLIQRALDTDTVLQVRDLPAVHSRYFLFTGKDASGTPIQLLGVRGSVSKNNWYTNLRSRKVSATLNFNYSQRDK
jgi:hypothetical protein